MFLALKELKHAKLRFAMIGTILVLISWLVFILSGLGNGLSSLSASAFKNIDPEYVVYEEGSRNSILRSVLSEDVTEQLQHLEHVDAAAPIGTHTAVILKDSTATDEKKIDVSFLGVTPGSFVEPKVIEGQPLTKGKNTEVIANATLKNKGIHIGDTLKIEGSTEVIKVVGFVKDQSFNHLPAIFMSLEQWRKIHFAAPGSDMGIHNPVNAIMLQGKNIVQDDVNQSIDGIEVATKSEAINGLPGYKEENGTIVMMLAFLMAISAVVITVFFYVLTLQKSNQFGIMKAIGANNRFLANAVISQVFILSVISIAIGILLTYGTAAILPEEMPFRLDPMLVTIYAAVLLIVSLLSSLFSVRKITKIDPLQAIGRVE